MNQVDLGWISGLLDGEGSIVLIKSTYRRKSDGRQAILPRVLVAVCDFGIVEKLTRLLKDDGIEFGYARQDKYLKQGAKWSRPNPVVQVWIAKHNSIIRLLEMVIPHLTLKKPNAELVLKYTRWQLDNGKLISGMNARHRPDIQDMEQEFYKVYQSTFLGKARSHERSIMEAALEHSVPIHWPN